MNERDRLICEFAASDEIGINRIAKIFRLTPMEVRTIVDENKKRELDSRERLWLR